MEVLCKGSLGWKCCCGGGPGADRERVCHECGLTRAGCSPPEDEGGGEGLGLRRRFMSTLGGFIVEDAACSIDAALELRLSGESGASTSGGSSSSTLPLRVGEVGGEGSRIELRYLCRAAGATGEAVWLERESAVAAGVADDGRSMESESVAARAGAMFI